MNIVVAQALGQYCVPYRVVQRRVCGVRYEPYTRQDLETLCRSRSVPVTRDSPTRELERAVTEVVVRSREPRPPRTR